MAPHDHADQEKMSLLNALIAEAAESIESSNANLYVIVTHYDADGLAAASIIGRVLLRLEKDFIIKVIDQVDEFSLSSIPKGSNYHYIFTDLGSASLNLIVERGFEPLVILDHHELLRDEHVRERVHEVNPHAVGINGSKDVSASGLAYLVASKIGVNDPLISYLAIAGAIGDRQEAPNEGFVGLNKVIVEEAINKGWIKRTVGLRLYGVPRQPLVKSLMYTVDPILPSLTYDELACQRFLELIGIPLKRPDGSPTTYKDLHADEISKLATALIKHLLAKGLNPRIADSLFGYMYEFLLEPEDSPLRYAHEYAQVLNACGRLRKHGIGLALGLGDRRYALSQAEALSLEYRRRLAQYISLVRSDASYIRLLNNIQVMKLDGVVDDRILGALSSIVLSSYICDVNRPLISATSTSHGRIKISARMHESLSKKGLNLGALVKQAAEHVGGSGGGHESAAGAILPPQTLEKFAKILDDLIGKTLRSRGTFK